ncbi:synaptotagmin-like protein 2 isoform X2 [Triplophysa dalaica]|uniref:synaptotagmin-like protein 2 isoform X2 n=1 Tax=Triplophysa dalaica TaxID=1582913 RepID=UPI0024DF9423|nr:synaptotagmin-like protein 2 isoform X2 [Triplophysa dalaica]
MIDLSYLTDEEQGKILAVLKRDTKLKNSEEQRIKKLHKTEKDKSRLKYLTGEWFYESKYHRHRDKIYGSDIIRASMGLRKPVTILELSQRWDEKDGFANREKRDVFIPPELVGLIEEPSTQSQSDRVDDLHSPDPQEQQRPQIKTRQNPFNSVNLQRVADGRINGVKEADQTPTEDHHELCAEPQSTQVSNFTSTADLTGKAFQLSNECQTHKVTEEEGRSIPKVLEWLWRDSQDGKLTKSVQREKNQMDPKDCGTSRAESPVVQQKTMPSPKPHRGLFALFSRAENKNRSLEVLVTNEEVTSQDNSTSEFKPDADDNIGLQDQNTKSKILQLENGNKAGGPVCEDSFQREIFLQTEVSPGRLANLKSFWERGMRRPKIPSMKNDEDEKQESEPSPQNVCNALDLSIGLLKSNEVILSNQNEKPSDLDSSEVNEDPVTKQQTDLIKTDVESLLSSSLLNDTDNTPDDKLKGDALTESLSTDTSDQRKEISTFKMSLSQQENKLPIDDLKSFWEKERSVLVGNVTHQESSSQCSSIELDIMSDSPDLMRSLNRMSLSSNKDDGLIVKEEEMEMNKKKQSLSTLPEQKQQDVRGRVHYTFHNTCNFKPKANSDKHSSPLPPLRSLSSKGRNESQESTDIYQSKDQDQTRTSSPLRQCKVPPRDPYPKNKSRKDGSPLTTFAIDIHPANKTSCTLKAKQGQTYEDNTSISLNFSGKLCKTKSPERNPMSLGQDSSELLTIPLDSKPFHSTAACSQISASMQLFMSAKHGDSEEDCPVKAALECAKPRPISISKSLEDLASTPALSAVTTNTKTSFSVPEQMKMLSLSVPAFNHDEMDYRKTDCASVSSFEFDRLKPYNTSSSICSEVASMSSVTGSAMSIYSSEFGNVEVKGTIQFAIHYLQKLGEFHIFVVQCEHLAVADPKRNRSDPYVKCYLLPDKAKYGKKKTCVRKKTLDPTYNEILRFKVPMDTLKTLKLNLSVWHNDTFGHNSFLGETELDLAEWDFNNTQRNEYLLKGRAQVLPSPIHSACSEEIRAEMRVVLRFLSQTSDTHKNKVNGEVQIWVKECKNLPISRGSIDPFVKCTILPDTTRKSHQKTRVLKKACNPEFNHTMVYEGFKPEDLKEACVELTVWDHDRLHNYFIGGIRLGAGTGKSYGADVDWMDSNGAEAALWERMMQCHNEWVEGVLPLRMLVMARMSR